MHTPGSSLRSKLAKMILVAAMVSLVALFATAARAQTDTATDTATDTPVTTESDPQQLPASDPGAEEEATPVRLPATGGNLATLALAGLTVVELGAGLMLLAGRRRRS